MKEEEEKLKLQQQQRSSVRVSRHSQNPSSECSSMSKPKIVSQQAPDTPESNRMSRFSLQESANKMTKIQLTFTDQEEAHPYAEESQAEQDQRAARVSKKLEENYFIRLDRERQRQ